MTETNAARDEILGRIRDALGQREPQVAPARASARQHAPSSKATRRARFQAELERVGGHVHLAADLDEARSCLQGLAQRLKLGELALSDHPLVSALSTGLSGTACFEGWNERERLFACDAGLSSAQVAIAETGTLVLESSAEKHRLVSLVPPIHVAVVPASAIVDGLDQALEAVRHGDDPQLQRCVSLITGPSRTGDIEMQLVVGVHGPRELHVIVIEEVSQ